MSVSIAASTKFYDGKTSNAHLVSITLSGSILHITNEAGENLASWSLTTIRIIEPPSHPAPGIIGSDKYPDARLLIEEGKNWTYLKSRIPKSNKRGRLLPTHWTSFFGYSAAAVLSLAFLFLMFPRILGGFAYMMPISWEKALGKHVMSSMVGSDKTCSAEEGQKALEYLTYRIKSQMKRKIKYDVRVIDNDWMFNAFAAPGGHIVIYRKIIDDASSAEELAGVLAHEMAHVELRHSTKSLIRDIGLGFTLSLIFGDIGTLESATKLLSQMSYSREDERAADLHAKNTLNAINISPKGLQDFLRLVAEEELDIEFKGSEFLTYLSSHPDTEERIKALNENPEQQYEPAMSAKDWNAVRNICEKTKSTTYE